jgi:putative ABC transport system permease protein
MRPSFWRRIPGGWSYVLRIFARRPEADIDAELRFHFDERIAELRAQGLSPDSARTQAREEFGDVDAVRMDLSGIDHRMARRRRRSEWGDRLVQDVRIALRGFRRTPAFAISVLAILGLGIGTAVAIFTVFRAVLLVPLPIRDPERVVVLTTFKVPTVEFGLVLADLKEIAKSSATLQEVGGFAHYGAVPVPLIDGDRSVVLNRVFASGSFFDVLGARPLLGRLLRPADSDPGAGHSLVLSYHAWRNTFAGDSAIIGHRIVEPYTQFAYTIVGVAPPGLDYPLGADFWIPPGQGADAPSGMSIIAIGRLAKGVTPAAAHADLLAIKKRLSPELDIVGAEAEPISEVMLGNVRPVLAVLTAAVILLLLVACVNVGNLLLLRAASRAQEVAIRQALGASYADLVRQLLLESGLLAVGGGFLGLAWAEMLLRLLIAYAPAQLPRTDVIALNEQPVAIAVGVTALTVVLFGVFPSLLGARTNVSRTLRLDSRSGATSRTRRSAQRLLVMAQTTLALVMISGSLLLARSFAQLERIDLGYDAEHLAILQVSWPAIQVAPGPKLYPMGEELMRRWRAIPGVVALTPTLAQPMLGDNLFLVKVGWEGQSAAERAANAFVPFEAGGEGYFRTFGIPLRAGRGFVDADREGAPSVAVVSESVARRAWPGQDPIGKRIHFGLDTSAWTTVIGVVGDVHLRTLRMPTSAVYFPWRQGTFFQNVFAVRTSGSLASVLPAIRREMHAVDPGLNLWYARPMSDLLAVPLAQPRMTALMMTGLGAAALLLAALGLYGLMASLVRERTRELGIRMALGAAPERLRRDVLAYALTVAGIGAAIGVAVALGLSRLLESLLFQVSPTDPLSLLSACTILLGVVLIAAYLPARRATRIDPSRALRAD